MIDRLLTDPSVTIHPPPDLPPDSELAGVRVTVTYAPPGLVAPHQMPNPYSPLELTVSGDLPTVANWIDENLVAGYYAVAGCGDYQQGYELPGIKRRLLKGGVHEFGSTAMLVERTLPEA